MTLDISEPTVLNSGMPRSPPYLRPHLLHVVIKWILRVTLHTGVLNLGSLDGLGVWRRVCDSSECVCKIYSSGAFFFLGGKAIALGFEKGS